MYLSRILCAAADAGQLLCLGDVLGDGARVFRTRRHERQHPAPQLGRARIVLSLVGERAGERQRLEALRIDVERAAGEPLGFARHRRAARHGERISEIGEEIGIARRALGRLGERVDCLRKATHRAVGAPEELPALDVARVLAQLRREARHHRLDLRHIRRRSAGIERARSAGREIDHGRDDRHGDADRPCGALSRRSHRHRLVARHILEQARLEFQPCPLVVLRREGAGGEISVELTQLVLVHGDVCLAARDARLGATREERPQHQHERERRESRGDEREADHSRSLAARLRSSALSCGAGTRRRRSRRASR